MEMENRMELQNIVPAIGKEKIIQVVKQYSNARSLWKSLYSFDQKYLFYPSLSFWKDFSGICPHSLCPQLALRTWFLPALSMLYFRKELLSLMPPHSNAQRHQGEESQYCVVLSSIVLLCFPRSPGQGINTMEIWRSSGNDLLPEGLNSTSVYPFCFRFDGGFTLLWEVAWTLSIFQFLQRRL